MPVRRGIRDLGALVAVAIGLAGCGGHVTGASGGPDHHNDCGLVELIGDQDGPAAIASDGVDVFWSNHGKDQGADSTISRMGIDGDHARVIASGREEVYSLAIDAGHVFWASGDPWKGQAVESMPRSGGAPETIATATLLSDFTINGQNLYWSSAESEVDRIPTSGGSAQPIVTGLDEPRGLAFDGTFVYFAMLDAYPLGSLLRAPRSGGTPTVLAKGLELPASVAVDDSWLYVGTWGKPPVTPGSVVRVPKDGGQPIVIASNLVSPENLLVDGGRLYWVDVHSVYAADLSTWKVTTVATVAEWGFASYALDSRYVYVALTGSGTVDKGYTGGTIWRVCKPVP